MVKTPGKPGRLAEGTKKLERETPKKSLNSFFIYRREHKLYIKEFLEKLDPKPTFREVLGVMSRMIGEKWRKEPQEVKRLYIDCAKKERMEHKMMYLKEPKCKDSKKGKEPVYEEEVRLGGDEPQGEREWIWDSFLMSYVRMGALMRDDSYQSYTQPSNPPFVEDGSWMNQAQCQVPLEPQNFRGISNSTIPSWTLGPVHQQPAMQQNYIFNPAYTTYLGPEFVGGASSNFGGSCLIPQDPQYYQSEFEEGKSSKQLGYDQNGQEVYDELEYVDDPSSTVLVPQQQWEQNCQPVYEDEEELDQPGKYDNHFEYAQTVDASIFGQDSGQYLTVPHQQLPGPAFVEGGSWMGPQQPYGDFSVSAGLSGMPFNGALNQDLHADAPYQSYAKILYNQFDIAKGDSLLNESSYSSNLKDAVERNGYSHGYN